jgi:uncharacterized membrane protein
LKTQSQPADEVKRTTESKFKNQNSKMASRIAAILALIAFVTCLVIGAFEASNSFSTTVLRALVAMVITLLIGLVLGAMAQKMLDENMQPEEEKLKKVSTPVESSDR